MTEILDGNVNYYPGADKAFGGTELMIHRMIRDIPNDLFQGYQIIHSRLNHFNIRDDKKTILVCHDLPQDPCYDKLKDQDNINKIDMFVFVSYWQKQYFQLIFGNLPKEKCFVIRNGIEPFHGDKQHNTDKINLVYHTTPHRGLEILIPVFEKLREKYGDRIELDVFSSFEIYNQKDRDDAYKGLFKNRAGVNYHGFQPNSVVRDFLFNNANIYAYPCIWPETSCLSVIEALSAGVLTVTSDLAVLPETTAGFASLYQFTENKNLNASLFYKILDLSVYNMLENDTSKSAINIQQVYFNSLYDWNGIVENWKTILKG